MEHLQKIIRMKNRKNIVIQTVVLLTTSFVIKLIESRNNKMLHQFTQIKKKTLSNLFISHFNIQYQHDLGISL